MKTALATLGSLLLPIAAHAVTAPMERLVGEWISPDGSSRQRVESHFDGSWLSTRMWFRNGEEWVEVGREWRFVGADRIDYAVYRPGEEEPWIEGKWMRREAGD